MLEITHQATDDNSHRRGSRLPLLSDGLVYELRYAQHFIDHCVNMVLQQFMQGQKI